LTASDKTIDWRGVKSVLVVRLRSIGDTVLATPSLTALRRFLPDAKIDILLEDWVAPLLDDHEAIDEVIAVGKGLKARAEVVRRLRKARYDVAFNLHGGTTSTFLTVLSGAKHRVGYSNYQYSFLYNHLLSSSSDFWGQEFTHSAEQQLALLGSVGIPVEDRPQSRLTVTAAASASVDAKFDRTAPFALIHPAAAFATKQWDAENFARIAEYLAARGIKRVAIATKKERLVLERLTAESRVPITTFDDLSLPEIVALTSKAELFIGNDSGIAHIAAAVNTPSVVVFGSSNRNHWGPWTSAPAEMVFEKFNCQPCPGYVCEVYGEPRCILSVKPDSVIAAIERVLKTKK
jgi:lipopolysaccharide heptosyltransferase II